MTKMLIGAIDAALLGAALLGAAGTTVQAEPRAVIELFTSQGCSSCPAADKLLSELKSDPSLITLSLPIDYWDYLGWKDTLASPGHTARQKAYSTMRGDREVYTPQVVVNGVSQALGSNRSDIEHAVTQSQQKAQPLSVPVQLAFGEDRLTVTVPKANGEASAGEVWLCPVSRSVSVGIGRGENRGRTITYTNVVRRWIRLGSWSGKRKPSACRSTPSSPPASMPWPSSCWAAAPTSPVRCSVLRSPHCTDICSRPRTLPPHRGALEATVLQAMPGASANAARFRIVVKKTGRKDPAR
jgi:hypothetical protein